MCLFRIRLFFSRFIAYYYFCFDFHSRRPKERDRKKNCSPWSDSGYRPEILSSMMDDVTSYSRCRLHRTPVSMHRYVRYTMQNRRTHKLQNFLHISHAIQNTIYTRAIYICVYTYEYTHARVCMRIFVYT